MPHAIVVGAGPAGASLAYLLARAGSRVTLLERQTDFAREFRGEALMPSGADALAQMGLAAELEALPQTRIGAIEVYRGARRLFRLALGPEQMGAFGPRIVSQPALLEMLVAVGARWPGYQCERRATVRDVVRDGERVVGVRYDAGAGAREVRGDLVIGTDGRSSVVRRRSGLHEEAVQQAFDVVWCKVPLPAFIAQAAAARAYLGDGHLAIMFPTYDDHLQIAWIINKGSFGDLRRRGIDDWVEEMAAHVSPDLAPLLRASRAAITHPFLLEVVSDRVRRWSAPGMLLLGDAAHTMSPVGGQGINLALRDALVAANHLCPALAAGAQPAALDEAARRIEAERVPEVVAIQRLQSRPPRVLFGTSRLARIFTDALLPLLVSSGVAPLALGAVFRRFANGVVPVRLSV